MPTLISNWTIGGIEEALPARGCGPETSTLLPGGTSFGQSRLYNSSCDKSDCLLEAV